MQFDKCEMERKLKQKSFSDVLEEAIKQRWGTKRKTSLVNFPRNTKKCKVQPLGFATSQQDNQGTSVADQESLCLSQPIISENKSYCAKQAVRGWKPPLKRFQEIKDRINAKDVNSITSSKLTESKAEPKGSIDDNNLKESFSQANLVYSEAKSGSENVWDEQPVHEGNSAHSKSIKVNITDKKESIGCTLLPAASEPQDTSQIPADLVAQENASDCVQKPVFDKETDLENPALLHQVLNESREYKLTTPAVNEANSEEMLSKTNTEVDLKSDDCLSQQSTQPYVPSDNITHAENIVIVQEEIEKPSHNSEELLLPTKTNIFEKSSYLTTEIPNVAVNAFDMASAEENDDATKDFPLSLVESTPNENFNIVMEETPVPGKEVQDTMDSKGFKKFIKEEPPKSGSFSRIISKSKMAQIQQNGPFLKQNDDIHIDETGNSFNAEKKFTNEENITGGDTSVSDETIVITSGNSIEENSNKECAKGLSLEIKSGSTEITGPKPCDDADVYVSTGKFYENKMLVFDAKKYTEGLEAKFRNVFHFENYVEETPGKEKNPVFDNNEEPPIKISKSAPKEDTQMKTSENYHACNAAIKLGEGSSACQKSADASFLEQTKTSASKDDTVISSVACNTSSLLESCNEEMNKDIYSTTVLPLKTANLHINQNNLMFDDEDNNVKSPNNTESVEIKENAPLIPVEKRSKVLVSDETKTFAEYSNMEGENNSKYQETLEVTNAASSQSTVRHDGKIHSEDKIISQNNSNDFVTERDTLTEKNSEETFIKHQRNILLESENINNGNKLASQPAVINPETVHAVDKKTASTANMKTMVEDCSSSKIEKYLHVTNTNHCSWNERLKGIPEDVIPTACFNSDKKNLKPSSRDLTNQISTSDAEIKNGDEILNNFKSEQFPHKNKTEKETGHLILTDTEEPAHITSKNHKQPENKYVLIPDATNDEVATKHNNNNDFSEMEDDFGLTVSQILRIEDECKQKMFMPEMSPLRWAQKVMESRRKIQAVIQEITTLNAMLKKVRKEVWVPQSNANTEESTSTTEDFNTFPRPASYRWNRNLNPKSRQSMQRK